MKTLNYVYNFKTQNLMSLVIPISYNPIVFLRILGTITYNTHDFNYKDPFINGSVQPAQTPIFATSTPCYG